MFPFRVSRKKSRQVWLPAGWLLLPGSALVAGGGYASGKGGGEPDRRPSGTAAKPAPGQRVNRNTASQAELERIPGIGPAKAKAIIQKRLWRNIEDIRKVKGIKDKTCQKIKGYLTVE